MVGVTVSVHFLKPDPHEGGVGDDVADCAVVHAADQPDAIAAFESASTWAIDLQVATVLLTLLHNVKIKRYERAMHCMLGRGMRTYLWPRVASKPGTGMTVD